MQIKYLIIKIWKLIMRFIYFIFKLLFRTRNKITFLSRQTNGRNIDFELIINELQKQQPKIKIVVLNKRLESDLKSKILYGFHMFRQMYHMATSKIIILDSYAILVSILKQKKNTKVIQLWHALGSLKKFGYSILGKKEGRNKNTAMIMDMHKNNDYIITSSEISKKYFMEAFNSNESQMIVLGLPRIDFLQSKEAKNEIFKKFYLIYKETDNNKKNILYVPTMRKDKSISFDKIRKSVNYSKYNLIIKTHSGKEIIYVNNKKIQRGEHFLGMELLHIADYIITDYSAIVYEATLVKKPIYFYTYDYKEYTKNRGFYIDYNREMPGLISKNINTIINDIENNKNTDLSKIEKFSKKYIQYQNLNITQELVKIIINVMNNKKMTLLNK